MRTTIFWPGRAVLLALSLAVPPVAHADDRLYYGSRAGMHLTTFAKSGIGTANAVIRIKHTPEDAKAFCVEYMVDTSPACVRKVLAELKIADQVSGNCTTRVWTDMYGDRYAFQGVARNSQNKNSQDLSADYAIKDLRSGEILDGSPPSGYDVQLTIFRQLCPGVAK